MPSGCAAPTSIVLMSVIVFVSNIRDRLAAREAMARLRVDRGAIASDAGNLADRFERVEIEDRQPCLDDRRRGRSATRDVQPASGDVSIDVVPAAFSANPSRLEHLVRTALLSRPDWRESRNRQRKH